MAKFEYRAETFAHPDGTYNPTPEIAEFVARLNTLGAEEWECYAVFAGAAHLKRKIPEPQQVAASSYADQVQASMGRMGLSD